MAIVNPTSNLRLEQQVAGSNDSVWGDRANANFARIDQNSQNISIDVTAGDVTLTGTDSGDLTADAQTRYKVITASGNPTNTRSIIWPTALSGETYFLQNPTIWNCTFKVSGQPGYTLAPGESGMAMVTTDVKALIGTLPALGVRSLTALIGNFTQSILVPNSIVSGNPTNQGQFPTTQGLTGTATVPNGAIRKWGNGTVSGGTQVVTFAAAFPGTCAGVQLTQINTTPGLTLDPIYIGAISAAGFTVFSSAAWPTTFYYWHAYGY